MIQIKMIKNINFLSLLLSNDEDSDDNNDFDEEGNDKGDSAYMVNGKRWENTATCGKGMGRQGRGKERRDQETEEAQCPIVPLSMWMLTKGNMGINGNLCKLHKLSPKDRKELVEKKQVCRNCLKTAGF